MEYTWEAPLHSTLRLPPVLPHECRAVDRVIVPLKWIEYGVYGDLIRIYPKPYSIYLKGPLPKVPQIRNAPPPGASFPEAYWAFVRNGGRES